MASPDFFVGVVTHRESRFPEAHSDDGAAKRLQFAWERTGSSAEVRVEDRDLWTESDQQLPTVSERSLRLEELAEDRRWREFLGVADLSWRLVHTLRRLRAVTFLSGGSTFDSANRLLNIELAHLALWEQGLSSGAQVIVVLEDDALLSDPQDAADGLTGLAEASWSYVNVSHSFGQEELGVKRLLVRSDVTWSGSVPRLVLRGSRPLTNTVCAVAYQRAFLERLVRQWKLLPLFPLLPIDWKLNRVLRTLVEAGEMDPHSSLWVEPGPFIQRSLH